MVKRPSGARSTSEGLLRSARPESSTSLPALAGLVTTTPLAVVGILMVAGTTPFLVYWWVDMIAHWKDLRMGHDWSLTPPRDDAERRIRKVYTRALPVELIWVIGCALIIAMVITR